MSRNRFRIGSIAVLFAVVVLCVAIFGVLTVSSAVSDRRAAERYGEHVEVLYACENAGQDWLSEADAYLKGAGDLPENTEEMVRVARSTSIPIAAGERLFGRFGFRRLIEQQAVSVVQPDLCHCGGIFEARKIAAMAETYYMQVAPHNPLGPISLAACLQLDACIPNLLAQEHPAMPNRQDLGVGILKKPFVIESDGCIRVPTGDGLGIEVDEQAMAKLVSDGHWDTPHLFFEDGSVADW